MTEGVTRLQALIEHRVVVIAEVRHCQGNRALVMLGLKYVLIGIVDDEFTDHEAGVYHGVGVVTEQPRVCAVNRHVCGLWRHVLGSLQQKFGHSHVICGRVLRTFFRLDLADKPRKHGAGQIVDGVSVDVVLKSLWKLWHEAVPVVTTVAAASDCHRTACKGLLLELIQPIWSPGSGVLLEEQESIVRTANEVAHDEAEHVVRSGSPVWH
mmetsp:Transcript_45365/g.140944  ORF Transcript_45365/g.140944 Transcript_45365/m.140944 type:complete len:210 (+) Transcript_45365:2462-3091(+)